MSSSSQSRARVDAIVIGDFSKCPFSLAAKEICAATFGKDKCLFVSVDKHTHRRHDKIMRMTVPKFPAAFPLRAHATIPAVFVSEKAAVEHKMRVAACTSDPHCDTETRLCTVCEVPRMLFVGGAADVEEQLEEAASVFGP